MTEEFEAIEGSTSDRRTFIKRSAVLGGMVWAAPAISTLGSRAFAETQGTPRDCHAISYLAVVIDTSAGRYQFKWNKGGPCEDTGETAQCTPPDGWQNPLTTNTGGCGVFTVDDADECCWIVNIPTGITVTKIVGVAMGAGGDKTTQGYCVDATYTNGGNQYRFCAPPK
jgi:hypothetical protein